MKSRYRASVDFFLFFFLPFPAGALLLLLLLLLLSLQRVSEEDRVGEVGRVVRELSPGEEGKTRRVKALMFASLTVLWLVVGSTR